MASPAGLYPQRPCASRPTASLNAALRLVGSLGGLLGRKGDGNPGSQTLWLGLQRLDDITATYKVFVHLAHPHPVPSRRYGTRSAEGRG
ncbi:MAG: IS4 family transposase [Terriglobia bacterium]